MFNRNSVCPIESQSKPEEQWSRLPSVPSPPPIAHSISESRPSYMDYEQTVAQIKKWNQEAPELTEVATYGKSSRGKDCYYIRICNKHKMADSARRRLLITACIHGNEPLASSTIMWYIGEMLAKYGKDDVITQILDSCDIYFVPVLSPDSYPSRRHVDGVDPNRDFPSPSNPTHRSAAPVAAIQELYMKIKPNAVISGHTWGRVYLTPYGDKMQNAPHHEAIWKVMRECQKLSGYRLIRACDMYQGGGGLNNPSIRTMGGRQDLVSVPIYGSEVDWYYRGGNSQGLEIRQGSFAIVCEFGTHQRIPSTQDTQMEFDKTFKAFLHFVKAAPLIEIWWKGDQPVNRDGTLKIS